MAKIINILADGTVVKDLSGYVLDPKEFSNIYNIVNKMNEELANGQLMKASGE